MVAPAANAQFIARSGTTYTSNAFMQVLSVVPGDIESLTNMGCVVTAQRPVVTPVNSSYIVQGAINIIPSTAASTVSYAYTLALPTLVNGPITTIVQYVASTAVSTITASAATISTGTVLSFSSLGSVDLLSVGSSAYAIIARTFLSSLTTVASS